MENVNCENILGMLLKDIGRFQLLTREEEISLAKKALSGDKIAKNNLINHNMRFVVKESKKFLNKGLAMEDLIIEGCIGLNDAVMKFDISKGVRFITFAVYRINLAMKKALHEQSHTIYLPEDKSIMLGRIYQALDVIGGSLDNLEVQEKVANLCNISIKILQKIMLITDDSFSFNDKVQFGNSEVEFSDLFSDEQIKSPENLLIDSALKTEFNKILRKIPNREAEIIRLKYGFENKNPLSLQKIGNKMNLSKERVRQLKDCAIRRLREKWSRDQLESFLYA